MKKLILYIFIILIANQLQALEPLKIPILNTSGTAVSVQVLLNDYTGGTATNIYTGPTVSLTPNGSGIIIVNVSDNINSDWSGITPSQVNSYYLLDVYVNTKLYAQYRLDQQIINQSQVSLLENNGNLIPTTTGISTLGTDDSRWKDLFLSSNTLHIGPAGGLAGNNEMALSYDNSTHKGTVFIDGNESMNISSDRAVITGDLIADPTGNNKSFIIGDDNFDFNSTNPTVERKLYYDGSKAAFRVGNIDKDIWDDGNNVGLNSIAMGSNPLASGISSFSIGNATEATQYGAIAIGFLAKSNGFFTNAIGNGVIADESSSIAIGMNNNSSVNGEILTVGNGTDDTHRSNAFEVYKNGEVVIPDLGNSSSNQNLLVNANGKLITGTLNSGAFTTSSGITKGNTTSDDFLFGTNSLDHTTGSESKLFFDNGKSAFRVGLVSTKNWDNDSLGNDSFASGDNPIAKGDYSVSIGYFTQANATASVALGRYAHANGNYSVAIGNGGVATGTASVALGFNSESIGNYSTSMGRTTIATGDNSVSMGYNTEAKAVSSVAMGYGTQSLAQYSLACGKFNIPDNSHLFVVGNGTGLGSESNAFAVKNDGGVIMGDDASSNHTVNGTMKIQNVLNANGSTGSVAVHFSDAAPTTPVTGSLWYDSINSKLKIWDSSTWIEI